VLVEGDSGELVLIDAGPEFRLQGLRAGLTRLDAVLVTHAHADHIHGLDDVRPLTRGNPLPVYASKADTDEIRLRFSYAFAHGQEGGGKPRFTLVDADEGVISVGTLRIQAIPLMHGARRILGFRIGGFAYLTDCSRVPESSKRLLQSLDLLVVGALRLRPHPTHFSVDEALELARELQPGRILLTHICHDLTHGALEAHCAAAGLPFPAGPAWDDLMIEF
jgi:phosphoribosyl 1,2-cyclic phosphate phosphodiesterase